MTKTKITKRELLASVISVLICISLLIGGTFAWFTDTATTGVNTITAGNLDIDIVKAGTNTSLNGQELGFVSEDGVALTSILWEPGCRYLLEPAEILNKGNLNVKYKVTINGFTPSGNGADLASVIDVYVGSTKIGTLREVFEKGTLVAESTLAPGGRAAFSSVKLVMQESAGNTYQNASISGVSINVSATQAVAESDSFGTTYDAAAPLN